MDPSFDFDELFYSSTDSMQQDQPDDGLPMDDDDVNTFRSPTQGNASTFHRQASSTGRSSLSVSSMPELICGVCSALAHGYNFDQITCESCKAFFRRNALKPTVSDEQLFPRYCSTCAFAQQPPGQCRFDGCCVINAQTRRHCAPCRLKKCFDIKMRKDWIRTDEEREVRRLQNQAKERRKMQRRMSDQQAVSHVSTALLLTRRVAE